MREGGKILSRILKTIKKSAIPGIETIQLEKIAQKEIKSIGAECAFLGYKGSEKEKPFPSCLCTSINEEIVHVPPSHRRLKNGDILKLDIGIKWKGFYLDMATTVGVGEISREGKRLIRVTRDSLKNAIRILRPGITFGDLGFMIQQYIESHGFNVVRELCGHGIGRELHEDPRVLNYGKRGEGEIVREGMVFCIEPMVTMKDWRLERTKDGFGFKTKDNSLTAHFEATVFVTKNGCESFTNLI